MLIIVVRSRFYRLLCRFNLAEWKQLNFQRLNYHQHTECMIYPYANGDLIYAFLWIKIGWDISVWSRICVHLMFANVSKEEIKNSDFWTCVSGSVLIKCYQNYIGLTAVVFQSRIDLYIELYRYVICSNKII